MWAIEGYEPLAQLAHTSTGVTVSARDFATGAVVAITYLSPEVAESPDFLNKFRAEVDSLCLIEHPNVANIYELVEHGQAAAVVSEHIDGVSLRTIIDQTGPLETQTAFYVVKSALLGLGELHRRGITHRVVSPDNLIVDATGTVKVVGVGIAPTSGYEPVNHPYAAPELWAGLPATAATDVYAVAAILFECLSGRPPMGPGGTDLGRSGQSPEATIGGLRQDLAPQQARLFMTFGLAIEPRNRPIDARAMLPQLDIVAFTAFGSDWFDNANALLRRRIGAPSSAPPYAPTSGPAYAPTSGPAYAPTSGPAYAPTSGPAYAPTSGPAYTSPTSGPSYAPTSGPAYPTSGPAQSGPPAGPLYASPVSGPVYGAPYGVQPTYVQAPPNPGRTDETDGFGSFAPQTSTSFAAPPGSGPPPFAPPRPSGPSSAPRSAPPMAPRSGPPRPISPVDLRDRSGDDTSLIAPIPRGRGNRKWDQDKSHRQQKGRVTRVLLGVVVLVLIGGGAAYAVTTALEPGPGNPGAVTTNSHIPWTVPGPTVPVPHTTGPRADINEPSTPAGLKVVSRSVNGVSLDWGAAVDDIKLAGYLVLRNGTQVGTTYDPGYTDAGLKPDTKYQYTVAAFDAAGNVSAPSTAVSAQTLKEPDVAPPSVPTNLHSTGKSTSTIALAWNAAADNIGVAGYEVFRDGVLITNVAGTGYTDTGLAASSGHTYRVRAFDASNNASADSNPLTVTTLAAPDTTAPSVPSGVQAQAQSTTSIKVSWGASTDNIGVTKYVVFRGATQVADVLAPTTTFTDTGLTAGTPYSYTVRAYDAASNASAASAPASDTTFPPPTTPPPAAHVLSVTVVATNSSCTVTVTATVTADAPMNTTLTYSITGKADGSQPISIAEANVPQTFILTTSADGSATGVASAGADGKSGNDSWSACPPPPTTDPPTDPPTP